MSVARVLIVDDSTFSRLRLRAMLESVGAEVIGEAESGDAGVALCAQLGPDLVTMDCDLPGLSGIEATRRIVASDPQARVLMISALAHRQVVLDAMRAGARDFLTKPVDPAQLRASLERVLGDV